MTAGASRAFEGPTDASNHPTVHHHPGTSVDDDDDDDDGFLLSASAH